MPDEPTATLTHRARELVWGIQSSRDVVTGLSRRIDEHVRAVNALRAELAERLERLDGLRESVGDPSLLAYLDASTDVVLPTVDELWPERLYRR